MDLGFKDLGLRLFGITQKIWKLIAAVWGWAPGWDLDLLVRVLEICFSLTQTPKP